MFQHGSDTMGRSGVRREGLCTDHTAPLRCSPIPGFTWAGQHWVYSKVKKDGAAKPAPAISKEGKKKKKKEIPSTDKQSNWVLFNRPLMLQRHKIGTRESCL